MDGSVTLKQLRKQRGKVVELVRDLGQMPMCLGCAKDGGPRHPLMLSYETKLERYLHRR